MMKQRCGMRLLALALAGLLCPLALEARADEAKDTDAKAADTTKADTEAAASEDAIDNVSMGMDLADFGRKNKMPEALVTAALVLSRYSVSALADAKEGKDAEDVSYEPADLLKEAKKMAATKTQKALVSQAESDLKDVKRGFLSDIKSAFGKAGNAIKHEAKMVYQKGKKVVIAIHHVEKSAVGKAKKVVSRIKPLFKVIVRDAKNKIVATAQGAKPIVNFIPQQAGNFKIEIEKLANEFKGMAHFKLVSTH